MRLYQDDQRASAGANANAKYGQQFLFEVLTRLRGGHMVMATVAIFIMYMAWACGVAAVDFYHVRDQQIKAKRGN